MAAPVESSVVFSPEARDPFCIAETARLELTFLGDLQIIRNGESAPLPPCLIVEQGLELLPVLEDGRTLVGVLRWQEVFQECARAALGAKG